MKKHTRNPHPNPPPELLYLFVGLIVVVALLVFRYSPL